MRRLLPLMLIVTLLAACGAQPAPNPGGTPQVTPAPGVVPTQPGAEGKVTISFAVWDYERATYQPLADKFMGENPDINVVLVPLDDLMGGPASSAPQGPESPTAMLRRLVSTADTAPSFALTPEAYGSPLLLDLKPLMDGDPSFNADDFFPGALDRFAGQGGTWALPRTFYLSTLSYNRDLFAQAGVAEPESGWSWGDLLATAEQLTVRSGLTVETYGYMDTTGGLMPLLALLEAQGSEVLGQSPEEVDLTAPEIRQAVEQLRELSRDGVILQPYAMMEKGGGPNGEPPRDPSEYVRQSQVAIWGDVYVATPDGQPWKPDFDVGRVAYPVSQAQGLMYGGGAEGFIISGGTAYPNESWRWIEWLSRQPLEIQPGEMPGRLPARQSVAEAIEFWTSLDESSQAAFRYALENMTLPPTDQNSYLVIGALSQAASVVMGDPTADPGKALADAQQWLRETYEQNVLTPTPEPDLSPVLVATPEPQTAPAGATTIRFGAYGYSAPEIRRIARAFREERPDIFIELVDGNTIVGDGQQPPQVADLAAQADCFSWNGPPSSADDFTALLDLQPLFDADAAFPISDYPAGALTPFRSGDGLYGLPYTVSMRNLGYNKTLFEAAGLEAPTVSWTPDDFLQAAQALTVGEGSSRQYGYAAVGGVQADLVFFAGQFGARLTTGSGEDLRPNFDDPKTVEAIQWYIDLAKVHEVMPPIKIFYRRDDPGGPDPSYELLQAGKVGIWFDYGYGMFGGVPQPFGEGAAPEMPERNFEVGIAPLPVGAAGLASSDLYVRGMHISADAENPQACWDWLKYMSGNTSLAYGDMPARTSVATSEEFLQGVDPQRLEQMEIWATTLEQAGEPGEALGALYSPQLDTYWLWQAIMNTVEKDADLSQELAEAQRFTTAFAECVAEGKETWTCAAEVDPSYMGYNMPPGEGGPAGYAP